jgi:hypothetical protein
VLYPDPLHLVHPGSLAGRVLPANSLSLPVAPPNVTGVLRAQEVAVASTSGAVIAGTIGGWSCTSPGPAQFDGGYNIQKLPVGHSYTGYAEPLDGAVAPSQMAKAIQTLCRNATTDAGWPAQCQLCCARNPYAIYRSNLGRALNSSRKQYRIVQLPALTAEIGESHPPPNSNPGPSDATNIGRRGRITTAREASSAKCKAAAQVVEPKFPRVSATMGNRSSATPDFLASSATSRGLG